VTTPLVVGEATVDEIVELRRRVLRDGTPSAEPRLHEDDTPGAFHLAGRVDGELVACVSFMPQDTPLRPGQPAWRFRAMAVDPSVQGSGFGRVILAAGIERVRALGVPVVWASARDSAIGFYESMGMHVEGDGYVDANTALPHHVVIVDL
jgi:GNAT superfamily N-acetyltransferase